MNIEMFRCDIDCVFFEVSEQFSVMERIGFIISEFCVRSRELL